MNCLLIEMGEMACYQERCPQCGRIPPGGKALPGKTAKEDRTVKTQKKKMTGQQQNIFRTDSSSVSFKPDSSDLVVWPRNYSYKEQKSFLGSRTTDSIV